MRDHIISEIRRLATLNGGRPPGVQAFVSATGIIENKWRGKYWARWGDALIEAGFEPNSWQQRSDANEIMAGLVAACRHYRHFPTNAELSMLRASNLSIPSPRTIMNNLGARPEAIDAFRKHVSGSPDLSDVLAMLPDTEPITRARLVDTKPVDGHVYLIKSGGFYKIGRSDELERRVKEIRLALPDAAILVHVITTDDPPGIEAYWHRRFSDRRANGEWFKLTPGDVKAFVRRKFQ